MNVHETGIETVPICVVRSCDCETNRDTGERANQDREHVTCADRELKKERQVDKSQDEMRVAAALKGWLLFYARAPFPASSGAACVRTSSSTAKNGRMPRSRVSREAACRRPLCYIELCTEAGSSLPYRAALQAVKAMELVKRRTTHANAAGAHRVSVPAAT